MDRGAWPFFVYGVTCLVNSVSVCKEKRRGEKSEERRGKRGEKMKEKMMEKIKGSRESEERQR